MGGTPMKKILSLLLTLLLLAALCGCGADSGALSAGFVSTALSPADSSPYEANKASAPAEEEMFTQRDLRASYDESSAIPIRFTGSSATAGADSVKISGSAVTITEEGTYLLSGSLRDGSLIVDAPDSAKLQLVLDGLDISSSTSAALYISGADKVVLTLAPGSENRLANGGSFVPVDGRNIDAALYSRQDLSINGSGSLSVISPAGHGVVCKDDLVITGGNLHIEAASHALDANDSVRFTDASMRATAGKDGIHCENKDEASPGFVYLAGGSLHIQAQGDGVSAGSSLTITGGSLDILAGGGSEEGSKSSSESWGGFPGGGFGGGRPGRPGGSGESRGFPGAMEESDAGTEESSTSKKGLKAGAALCIEGGDFVIDSADDAVHANSSLTINGGSFQIASGDDAFHAEESLTVNDGTICISQSYEGLEALHVVIHGGDIQLTARDDGLNAAGGVDQSGVQGGQDGRFGGHGFGSSDGSIVITGGTLAIRASGDGIDANGTLEISGGRITVTGPSLGDTTVLDYDISASITGGSFLGTGSTMMAQTFSSSSQGVISVSVGTQPAGTAITLTDARGNTLFRHSPELAYQIVILSSPDMISGESYTITVGSQSAVFEAS